MNCKHDFHIFDSRPTNLTTMSKPKLGIMPIRIRVYVCKKCGFKKITDEYNRDKLQEFISNILKDVEELNTLKEILKR